MIHISAILTPIGVSSLFLLGNKHNIFLIAIITLSGGLLFLVLYIKIRNYFNHQKAIQRSISSKKAEKKAEKWLKKNGFKIIEKQQSRPLIIKTGKTSHRYLIRTDFLVKKGGHKYVVEVKSGRKNSKVTNRETRRQLLEYFLAYQTYGIILFDMERNLFSEVKFLLPYFHSKWIENAIYFILGALSVMLGLYFLN
ncbi:MAG: HK97 gp10 family phage protein [Atribacterota bacterium]|nr:HK97 gp10 family phage protein [Atribacterota bacterium]MDD3640290.1 HK97 gp10 family phage protein [Atribacterota bacterium]MDD5634980.1 HK97 gp10 family phage protein [Atribacterota bacterium]